MIRVSRAVTGPEEAAAITRALDRGYYGHAELVVELEERLREFLGAPEVVCVANGTAALHLALAAMGIGPGDEVIVPSLTFVASFQAIAMTGAEPVPCEVDDATLSIDVADAMARVTPRTKAVMPVHFGGGACDLDVLLAEAGARGIRVVEDAAHAFGSTSRGRMIGSFGDVQCFSFDSIKNITSGEGGAVSCSDPDLASRIRQMRLLGIDREGQASSDWRERQLGYEVRSLGFRYHMSNLFAAIGIEQLKKADTFIKRRREIARSYDEGLAGMGPVRTLAVDYDEAAPHIYVIRVGDGLRDGLRAALRERDIETGINYVPNHLQPYFELAGGRGLPRTERLFEEILTLPLHAALTDAEVAFVIDGVREYVAGKGAL